MLVAPCFHTGLRLEKVGRHDWELTDPLIFESKVHRGLFILPRGSVIDLTSTPRAIWWLLPKTGQYDLAAAVHDGAYRGLLVTIAGERVRLIRSLADALMDEACEATGVSGWERRLLYRGVRLFGGSSYKGVADGRF